MQLDKCLYFCATNIAFFQLPSCDDIKSLPLINLTLAYCFSISMQKDSDSVFFEQGMVTSVGLLVRRVEFVRLLSLILTWK